MQAVAIIDRPLSVVAVAAYRQGHVVAELERLAYSLTEAANELRDLRDGDRVVANELDGEGERTGRARSWVVEQGQLVHTR